MENLNIEQIEALKDILKDRFDNNMNRHPNTNWDEIWNKVEGNARILWSLNQMEITGGEPDVVELNGDLAFVDCSAESPVGRRSLCYDDDALQSRKANVPMNSAMNMAATMAVEVLNESEYRELQATVELDRKTSSWIATPDELRALGGALFCDRRYNRVFTYHNGAESYYSARGFRGKLKI